MRDHFYRICLNIGLGNMYWGRSEDEWIYVIDTSANLVISKSNEVFLKINTEPHIEYELRDHFKFEVPKIYASR